ncbi:MAG: 4-hydroxy-tetrahydrodipicolinate synthase [Bacteroidetes bacterium]|nr:4-hydroxy-tetrahydrodipicolinate synthase [Bacteroidota bacterium]
MNKMFRGTGVALVTPFTEEKKIDYPALDRILNHILDNGIDYLVVLGTTGESVSLEKEEKKQLVDHVVKQVKGRVPIVIGIGGNNTNEILDQFRHTDFTGINAILSVSPYYNKPQQDGIYQHYRVIAENSPLPLILYNVPGRTGSNMTASTTLRLAREFEKIIGIKEASGNLPQIMEILEYKPDHFDVISGDDLFTIPLISMGAIGIISVAAHAVPKDFCQMVRYALDGNFEQARKLHFGMQRLMTALFADGSPAGIKAALEILGMCKNELRLPLVPVNEQVYSQIKYLLTFL